MVNPEVGRVLRWQVRLILVAFVIALVADHATLIMPASVLIGGVTAIVPAMVYGRIAYAPGRARPDVLIKAHYKAEAVKFFLTLLFFAGVFLFFKDISVAAFFGGYIAAIAAYWFGLLIKN